jgi:hypothetical protein
MKWWRSDKLISQKAEEIMHFLLPKICNDDTNEQLIFQRDDTPPHYQQEVRNYLNQHFPDRRIGRAGAIQRNPQSPDLMPAGSIFRVL